MPIVRRDSRSRFGIHWYDDEAEATAAAARIPQDYPAASIASANLGITQVGRDPGRDIRHENGKATEFAVVVP